MAVHLVIYYARGKNYDPYDCVPYWLVKVLSKLFPKYCLLLGFNGFSEYVIRADCALLFLVLVKNLSHES
jgi:hypothetical protein